MKKGRKQPLQQRYLFKRIFSWYWCRFDQPLSSSKKILEGTVLIRRTKRPILCRGHQYNRYLLLECDLNHISIDDKILMRGLFPVGQISVEGKKKIYYVYSIFFFIILYILIYRKIYRVIRRSYRLLFKKRNRCYSYGERNYHKNIIKVIIF